MWLTIKVAPLPCSSSAFEHRWSIEDWIHSKRRNRLGQELVERLVCDHTNLKLEQRLQLYETSLLPWDIEMTVEEPLSDDEDGAPHSVSDSESKSESEKTLTKFSVIWRDTDVIPLCIFIFLVQTCAT